MAVADNVLSFELVTAQGEFVRADAETNADLFWALRGGGPAAYAVVLSATFKTVSATKAAGVILNINSTMTNSSDAFWEGVRTFHGHANRFVDNELYAYFELGPLRLHVQPIVGVGKSAAELDALVQPLLDDLKAKDIPYDSRTEEFDTFFELYLDLFEDEPAGQSSLTGGWAFSHQDVADNNDGIVEAFKTSLSPRDDLAGAGFVIGHLWKTADVGAAVTAMNPRFRNVSSKVITALAVPPDATWAQKQDLQHVLADVQDAALRKAGPGGCAYVNEADPYQEDWQGRFWGAAYPGLLAVRKQWDPQGLFYAVSTPGTEDWEVIDFGTKLCQRSAH